MTHEMIKRVATAIAEPRKRYVVKCKQFDNGEIAQWQIWLIEGNKEQYYNSWGKLGHDHTRAEIECEQLNNNLLACLAIEAMKEITPDLLQYTVVGFKMCWGRVIDAILKE